ncbi:hypothetical protein [Subtercola sp. YIM 133946]|uniref:hypothetical protein n=1 Tax=Subtercola sp. YIM 133946 TaxID=3118909 RepID=UPI002F91D82E
MQNHEMCERCEGSGADPVQPFADRHVDTLDTDPAVGDDVRVCVECFGDGYVEVFQFRMPERLSA